jgi:hypothetical protein
MVKLKYELLEKCSHLHEGYKVIIQTAEQENAIDNAKIFDEMKL